MENIVRKWDNLFEKEDYAYGTKPNAYFKSILEKHKPTGSILLPGEGEGRNAVFAATLGLDVFAFDISNEGKKKALRLAKANKVNLRYDTEDFIKMSLTERSFDVAALIYSHFHPRIQSIYHQKISGLVKPNGLLILEGFSIENPTLIKQNSELGSDSLDKFYSTDNVKNDFPHFEILELEEKKIELREGFYHNGTASVIRYVGKKKY